MWWKWGEGRDKRRVSLVQWRVASKGTGNGRMMTWQSAQCLECQSDITECRGMNVTNSQTYSSTSSYISREAKWRRNVYWPRPSVCLSVCLSVPCRIPTLLHRPRCNLGQWWGLPLVVQYWADLQLVHGFCCYNNIHVCKQESNIHLQCITQQMHIAPNVKCQRVLGLSLWLVYLVT